MHDKAKAAGFTTSRLLIFHNTFSNKPNIMKRFSICKTNPHPFLFSGNLFFELKNHF